MSFKKITSRFYQEMNLGVFKFGNYIQKKNMPIKVEDVKMKTVKPNLKKQKFRVFSFGCVSGSGLYYLDRP